MPRDASKENQSRVMVTHYAVSSSIAVLNFRKVLRRYWHKFVRQNNKIYEKEKRVGLIATTVRRVPGGSGRTWNFHHDRDASFRAFSSTAVLVSQPVAISSSPAKRLFSFHQATIKAAPNRKMPCSPDSV